MNNSSHGIVKSDISQSIKLWNFLVCVIMWEFAGLTNSYTCLSVLSMLVCVCEHVVLKR